MARLRERGYFVQRLVRGSDAAADTMPWDPARQILGSSAMEHCDAVINLAGANIGGGRWTARRREVILRSRIDATGTLIAAMKQTRTPPSVLLNASAVGCYGDRGDEELTEASPLGTGFLADVCRAWEAQAGRATECGTRVACLRFGMVLGRGGGALAKMLPVFQLGLGGRLGAGRQWMSWIHLEDVIGVVEQGLVDSTISGAINVVTPTPVRNTEFAATLARAVHRRTIIPAPAALLRLAFGQMAEEALLASTRVMPARLTAADYAFRLPHLPEAVRACV